MNVIRKDATIVNTDEDFPGSFEVVLSAPTKDRDGDTLLPDEWKQPLPDHITFDIDHGMSVGSTVGSGRPSINDNGELVVAGSYSSLPRAQEVRTLVNEGHIKTTSVAFMTETVPAKDGKGRTMRELLNGAFVAVPSNREALVLSSKGVKAGARNSAADAGLIQSIHDGAAALGADCSAGKSFTVKDAGTDVGELAQAVDAPLDEAINLLANVDRESLPAEVQQALALILAADAAIDELLDALGVPDPDEDDSAEPAVDSAAAPAKAAAPAETTAAEADALTLRVRSLSAFAAGYTSGD